MPSTFKSPARPLVVTVTMTVLVILGGSIANAQEDPAVIFEQARVLDENNTNLGEAIALYQKVAETDGQSTLAAEASLRVGLLYERLGRETDAQDAYEAVLRDYGDQERVVRQAEKRITAHAMNQTEIPGVVLSEVWSGGGVDILGSPSADGRYLSFVDWSSGDLALRDLAAQTNHRLTNKGEWMENIEYAEYSVISPDASQVAYSWFDPHSGVHDLRLVSIDGSNERILYRDDEDHYVQPEAWSSDGQRILTLVRTHDRTSEIAFISTSDGSKRVLKSLDWRMPSRMSLSPDGRYVVYDLVSGDGPDRDIYLLSTRTGEVTSLVDHPANDRMPIWSVDGDMVLFISDRSGSVDIWGVSVVDATGTGYPVLVRRNVGERVLPMGFTENGSLYYGLLTGVSDVYVAELDVSTGALLSSPVKVVDRFEGSNSSPEWSPGGDQLAMVQQTSPVPIGDGYATILIVPTDGGLTREIDPGLTRLGFYSAVRWSPDGEAFVVVSEDEQNRPGVYRIDASTGAVSVVMHTDPRSHVSDVSWFPDGASLLYSSLDHEAAAYSIVKYDLLTGTPETIYHTDSPSEFIRRISLSPDGTKVAFVEEDHSKGSRIIKLLSVQDKSVSTLQTPEEAIISHSTGLAWTPDGAQILFGSYAEAGDMALWRLPVNGGKARRTELTMPGLANVRFHSDGKRIAFVAGSYAAEVWSLSNFLEIGK